MAHKKYYGYKKPNEYYSVTFRNDEGKEGIALYFNYNNGVCSMNKHYWGAELDYMYSSDGDVECTCAWNKENTEKLMLRTGTHDGQSLVNAIYERFKSHGGYADVKIKEWCKQKGIEYTESVWY